jgi:hypothetical protein
VLSETMSFPPGSLFWMGGYTHCTQERASAEISPVPPSFWQTSEPEFSTRVDMVSRLYQNLLRPEANQMQNLHAVPERCARIPHSPWAGHTHTDRLAANTATGFDFPQEIGHFPAQNSLPYFPSANAHSATVFESIVNATPQIAVRPPLLPPAQHIFQPPYLHYYSHNAPAPAPLPYQLEIYPSRVVAHPGRSSFRMPPPPPPPLPPKTQLHASPSPASASYAARLTAGIPPPPPRKPPPQPPAASARLGGSGHGDSSRRPGDALPADHRCEGLPRHGTRALPP